MNEMASNRTHRQAERGIGIPTTFALIFGMPFVACVAAILGHSPLWGIVTPVVAFVGELLILCSLDTQGEQ